MPLGLRRAVVLSLVALIGVLAGVALASCGENEASTVPTTTVTATTTSPSTATATVTATFTGPAITEEEPTVVRVTVSGGVPEGGIVRETVDEGARVVLLVTSDVADEIHLHGYDLMRDVAAGATVRVEFTATIPGRFEVELEERGVQIAELTVEP